MAAISGATGANSSYRTEWEAKGGVYADEETDETESAGKVWNAVFEDKKSSAIDTESFLALIVAQMTNQDFMNPMDDTAMVTQMVQMNTMQMMQEMAIQTKTSYVMGLVGKTVTAARINVSGELLKETGPVQKVTLTNNEFAIYVNGKRFTLEQLMEIGTTDGTTTGTEGTGDAATGDDDLKKREYLNSLLNHEVSIRVTDEEGSYVITGLVQRVSSEGGKYRVWVNEVWYDMDQIIEVGREKIIEELPWDGGSTSSSGSSTSGSASGSTSGSGDNMDAGGVEGGNTSGDVNPDEKVDQDNPADGAGDSDTDSSGSDDSGDSVDATDTDNNV